MTEEQWRCCTDPGEMLRFLRETGRLSERKTRLFAVACCRRIWDLIRDERSRNAVAVAERHADGQAGPDELDAAFTAGVRAHEQHLTLASEAAWLAAHPLTRGLADSTAGAAALEARLRRKERDWDDTSEETQQSRLLRDIVGNPFRPVILDPLSRRPAVLSLATTLYDEHRFEDLPRLADVLADAGCTDAELLAHLRSPGPHVRGCWALDTVLART